VPPFGETELELSITMSPRSRPTCVPSGILIHPAVCLQRTWAENLAAVSPFGGAGSPSNTMWPRLRPTTMPSFILIHPTVWPNGWMDQDATWCGGRPRHRPQCVRWNPAPPRKGAQQPHPHFSAHVYCGQTVAHLSNC